MCHDVVGPDNNIICAKGLIIATKFKIYIVPDRQEEVQPLVQGRQDKQQREQGGEKKEEVRRKLQRDLEK